MDLQNFHDQALFYIYRLKGGSLTWEEFTGKPELLEQIEFEVLDSFADIIDGKSDTILNT